MTSGLALEAESTTIASVPKHEHPFHRHTLNPLHPAPNSQQVVRAPSGAYVTSQLNNGSDTNVPQN